MTVAVSVAVSVTVVSWAGGQVSGPPGAEVVPVGPFSVEEPPVGPPVGVLIGPPGKDNPPVGPPTGPPGGKPVPVGYTPVGNTPKSKPELAELNGMKATICTAGLQAIAP